MRRQTGEWGYCRTGSGLCSKNLFFYIYSLMKSTNNLNGDVSSFFDCCQECGPTPSESQSGNPIKRYIPSTNKLTHHMISPKASLKAFHLKRSQKNLMRETEVENGPAVISSRFGCTPKHATTRSNFDAYFKKTEKMQKKGGSLLVEGYHNSQVPRLGKGVYASNSNPQASAYNHNLPAYESSRIAIPAKGGNLEKTLIPTEASSKHVAVEDSRRSKLSNRISIRNNPFFDLKLGNSRFTVMSQEEYEESPKALKLEESDIVINVFNPTSSQLQGWNQHRRKDSMLKKKTFDRQ